jgi:hypothetical protein
VVSRGCIAEIQVIETALCFNQHGDEKSVVYALVLGCIRLEGFLVLLEIGKAICTRVTDRQSA